MGSIDTHTIVNCLDNTPRVLFWDFDEFLLILAPFFLGIVVGSFFVAISGIFLQRFYKGLKKRKVRGFLKHQLYWRFPSKYVAKKAGWDNFPPSHVEELLL